MSQHEIVGFLKDQGYDEGDIGEMIGPLSDDGSLDANAIGTPMSQYDRYGESRMPSGDAPASDFATQDTPLARYDAGESLVQDTVRSVLTQAQKERKRPGPQALVAPGTAKSKPDAKPVRVDTEDSYKKFRGRMSEKGRRDHRSDDSPQNTPSIEELSEREDRQLMGAAEFYTQERPIAGDFGDDRNDFYRRDDGAGQSTLVGADQACILCGSERAGTAVCGECRQRVVGFGERGAASQIYNPALYDALPEVDLLGMGGAERQHALKRLGLASDIGGPFDDRGTRVSRGAVHGIIGLTAPELELLGDLSALETPWPAYDMQKGIIPLSFTQEEAPANITAWQSGPDLYSSIRLTGWDRQPRVLTATVPYDTAMSAVVGYAQRAGVAPAGLIGVAHKLARSLGASALIPRLCAASPAVLGAVVKKAGPLIFLTSRR